MVPPTHYSIVAAQGAFVLITLIWVTSLQMSSNFRSVNFDLKTKNAMYDTVSDSSSARNKNIDIGTSAHSTKKGVTQNWS